MRLVITDTGRIWNTDNPFLEKYKEIVLVVCLYGRKITDKYECFVSPYTQVGMGIDKYGNEDQKFRALASVAGKLENELWYHDDIIFLTDNEPSTLYPYYVIKELNKGDNRLHLIAIPPLNFEGKTRITGYHSLMSDLSQLDSLLCYDINKKAEELKKRMDLISFLDLVRGEMGSLMPRFLNGIYHMREYPCYFDFASLSYIALRSGFESIDVFNRKKKVNKVDFPIKRKYMLMGIISPADYPDDDEDVKEEVERPVPRLDGKKVCNILREQRIKLAAANNIPFASAECPSIGPCAGTCRKCDEEADFLREEMRKIPEEKRIYPHFDPDWEVKI